MKWTNKQKQAFLEAMTAIAEIYGRTLSKAALKFYLRVLEQHPFESVMRALQSYIENATGQASYYPKPGDIVALIEGNPDDLAERAWQTVREAIERIGGYESVAFRDPLINAAVQQMGGWVHLCMDVAVDAKRLEFASHEFRRLYRGYLQTRKAPRVTHLPGECEVKNLAYGHDDWVPQPVTVGTSLPKRLQGQIVLIDQGETIGELKSDLINVLDNVMTTGPEMPPERTERGQFWVQ